MPRGSTSHVSEVKSFRAAPRVTFEIFIHFCKRQHLQFSFPSPAHSLTMEQPPNSTNCVELKHLDRTPGAPKDNPPAYTPNDTVVDMPASAETSAEQDNTPQGVESNNVTESTAPKQRSPQKVWFTNLLLLLLLVGFGAMIWYVTNG
jgi:hypothetical protein